MVALDDEMIATPARAFSGTGPHLLHEQAEQGVDEHRNGKRVGQVDALS
jgi:hypothetical protein